MQWMKSLTAWNTSMRPLLTNVWLVETTSLGPPWLVAGDPLHNDVMTTSSLPSSQTVGMSRMYHPECFTCNGCGMPLGERDPYTLFNTGQLRW